MRTMSEHTSSTLVVLALVTVSDVKVSDGISDVKFGLLKFNLSEAVFDTITTCRSDAILNRGTANSVLL